MKAILKENKKAVQKAGQALVEVGSDLMAGEIDNALERLAVEQQKYREWEELDQAILDIEGAIHERRNSLAAQQILTELAGTIIGTALRGEMH